MSVPDLLARLSFSQPARARADWELLRDRLPQRVLGLLPTVLAQVPDPDGALNNLERFSREAAPRVLEAMARQPALLHYLLALFSHSRFLSETLIQQPDLIVWLGRQKRLDRVQTKEELHEDYARFETAALDVEPALALARFKRRQYLRITLRDILGLATLMETTLELSTLADVLLEKALTMAEAELRRRFGAPQTTDPRGRRVPARFALVSLGKLGGNELNYSSDVDLLFLFAGEGETSGSEGGQRLANSEFFIRLAQRVVQLIAGVSREGPVFRVDLRLRPGGREGDLAISLPAALDYYRHRAREWELQMLLKGRHSAGNAALVREFLAAVRPFLYGGPVQVAVVESVLKAREGFDRHLDIHGAERLNVKLGPGGIRDVEFLVQCLQRLHGQQDPWVRAAGTLVGLQKLFDKGYLSGRDHFRLASAYQFLRLVEHRLQLDRGQQTHTLPADVEGLELLARRCGVGGHGDHSAGMELRRLLDNHLDQVRTIYERILPSAARPAEPEVFALEPPEGVAVSGELTYGEIVKRLRVQGSSLYSVLGDMTVPERARKPLHRFLAAALGSSATFEQVDRAAAALPRAVEIFRLSEPIGKLLIRQPDLLAWLQDLEEEPPRGAHFESLAPSAGASALPPALDALVRHAGTLSVHMAELRRYFADAVFRWGVRELFGQQPVEEGLRNYTALAEEVLRAGLAIAQRQCAASDPDAPALAVISLGRLGTSEMDMGSDADLLFVTAHSRAAVSARPVAEKLLHVISGYTREGTLFPVDVRLRPRGGEGELLQTAESVFDYFKGPAEVWEAVTYLKARPVAGDCRFGEQWHARLREVLGQRFSDWNQVRAALREMRKRLEDDGAEAAGGADNFKTGPGGFYDLDFILSAWALRAGALSLAGRSWPEQIEALGEHGGLTEKGRSQLIEAARLLRTVDHAIRLARGRSAPRLPTGALAQAVAELASAWLGERLSPGALAERLAETRRALRALFLQVFA